MKYLFLVGLVYCLSPAFAKCQSQLLGVWENESGSLLRIDSIADSGMFFGVYLSHEGTDGRSFPLTGTVNQKKPGNASIAFFVNWNDYGSITSWTGLWDLSKEKIETMWYYVQPEVDFEFQHWSTQSSTFIKHEVHHTDK